MSKVYYTTDHEWLKIDEDCVTIGITDHAQEALGDVVFVDLPEVGQAFVKGDVFSVVESVKAASDVYAPIEGEIIEVNSPLSETPELVNEAAETEAWFVKMRIKPDSLEVEAYMSHESYLESLTD